MSDPGTSSASKPEQQQQHPKRASSEPKRKRQRHLRRRNEYAQAVFSHSQRSSRSLYVGVHFERLASFLQQPFQPQAPNLTSTVGSLQDEPLFNFVTFYDLDPSSEERGIPMNSPDAFETKARELSKSPHGRLIFMKGQPSPEWLCAIGATYRVDPEFFRRHLNFQPGSHDNYSLPSLPSGLGTSLSLKLTTIGASVTKTETNNEQQTIEELREENHRSLDAYRAKFRSLSKMKLGDAVIREFSIHDLQQFTMEQDISLYVGTCDAGWFALIWLDITSKSSHGATPFLQNPLRTRSWTISSVPVIYHRPGLAFQSTSKPEVHSNRSAESNDSTSHGRISQNICLIDKDYGLDLDKTLIAKSSFYAVHEILLITAFSENQFLNMLETKLLDELNPRQLSQQKEPTVSNLLYNQRVLDRHIQRIKDNLIILKAMDSKVWPQKELEEHQQRIVDEAATNLKCDYEYLLSRSLTLSEQCSRGMQVVMNNAMIKESRDAIKQAEGLAKLTRLAFIFVPLSFTTSFFGMNFIQFGTGSLSIWMWFVVSTPILFVSLVSMRLDIASSITIVLKILKGIFQRGDLKGSDYEA